MEDAAVRDVLKRGRYCTLCCIDADGLPYGVPLSYIYEEPKAAALRPQKNDAANAGSAERDEHALGNAADDTDETRADNAAGANDELDGATKAAGALGTLYFHTTNEGGRKIDAFAACGRACATIVEDVAARFQDAAFTTGFSSVMAFGRIRLVEDAVTARKALVGLCMKYLPEHKDGIGAAMQADFDATAVWALDIEELSGKKN